MTHLFEPFTLGNCTLINRVGVAPMCQYSVEAQDGVPTDWHLAHLGSFAIGGFGLILTEAAAVSPEGRISPQDVGLLNDQQAEAWRRITDLVHTHSAAKIGVQLAHAGRKASSYRSLPGEPLSGSVPPDEGGWLTFGPSDVAFHDYAAPRAMTAFEIAACVADFAAAARRAASAGFDLVEIHAAHGYLLHQFLSPLSNQRTDDYGGSFDNRIRLLLEVTSAVRAVWDGPLLVRLSATDWLEGGWSVDETVALTTVLAQAGVDLIDVSSGGIGPAEIALYQGYQVEFAARVRNEGGLPTAAVGLITEPAFAEAVIADGQADLVLLAREALRNPHWPQHAARQLGDPAYATLFAAPYYRAILN